jgi:hypothetical protein
VVRERAALLCRFVIPTSSLFVRACMGLLARVDRASK